MSRTVDQKTNLEGFPKAAEIIEISGAHSLEAMDRAILNTLYQHAHDSGRLGEPDAEFEIDLARLRPSKHESNDRIRDALIRLMRVLVTVPYIAAPSADYPGGEPRLILTGLFSFFDLARDEKTLPSMVRYGLPKKLQPIIARSGRWGRIKAEVVCAMTSRYAISLYEMLQLRANLQKCVETFPIGRFRDLMGVPPGKLTRGNDLSRWVLETAALEVNGLSDIGVKLEPVRRSPRAPITAVTIAWWRKEGDEYRATLRELRRPKVGRMARLKGTVEEVEPPMTELADKVDSLSAFAGRLGKLALALKTADWSKEDPSAIRAQLTEAKRVMEETIGSLEEASRDVKVRLPNSVERAERLDPELEGMQSVIAKMEDQLRRVLEMIPQTSR